MTGPNAPQLIQAANRLNSEADAKFREGYELLEESRGYLDQLAAIFGMVKVPTGANEILP
jgi:hypothetical protein